MGKAFSEAQRGEVQRKLRETGLALFREKGIRGVSIREITAACGISLGCFYRFYPDKEHFLADLLHTRAEEKLELLYANRASSLPDPLRYLCDLFYTQGMRLTDNAAFDEMQSGTLELLSAFSPEGRRSVQALYTSYLQRMISYWAENGISVSCHEETFLQVLGAAEILITHASLLSPDTFPAIYRAFCDASIPLFCSVTPSQMKGDRPCI
ncbi:MAG: TetR/AcrR family transcriptional regulator [Clostridia bacterium]|nr:TetR/AcrR family transcriptional regulator [Clostridia bacterium]